MNTKFIVGFLFMGLTICSLGNAQEKDAKPNLSGSWSGNWISDGSGHKGPMKAVFRSVGTDSYEVTFSGRFFKFIPFRYKVTLMVTLWQITQARKIMEDLNYIGAANL
ncbi:MAG: hypothetical protein NTZ30_02600 [Planctomycetota bacterium]|nr:hypothetical protein [Planctomycetota bacterium]